MIYVNRGTTAVHRMDRRGSVDKGSFGTWHIHVSRKSGVGILPHVLLVKASPSGSSFDALLFALTLASLLPTRQSPWSFDAQNRRNASP